jgi:hypothetical protein
MQQSGKRESVEYLMGKLIVQVDFRTLTLFLISSVSIGLERITSSTWNTALIWDLNLKIFSNSGTRNDVGVPNIRFGHGSSEKLTSPN